MKEEVNETIAHSQLPHDSHRHEYKSEDEAMDVDEIKVDSESDSDWATAAPSKKSKRRAGKKVRKKAVRAFKFEFRFLSFSVIELISQDLHIDQ